MPEPGVMCATVRGTGLGVICAGVLTALSSCKLQQLVVQFSRR